MDGKVREDHMSLKHFVIIFTAILFLVNLKAAQELFSGDADYGSKLEISKEIQK